MGRAPCCYKVGLHRGPWTPGEDALLTSCVQAHGEGHWRSLPKRAGLLRCGKSCRLRWMNYLRPDIKRGNISAEEEDLIIRMHTLLGNRWSLIAGRLPGRTDNEIKNYWNTHLAKRLHGERTDLETHEKLPRSSSRQYLKKKRKAVVASGASPSTVRLPRKSEIHLPKPFRYTSLPLLRRSEEFLNFPNVASYSSSCMGEEWCLNSDIPWSDFPKGDDGDYLMTCDVDASVFNCPDLVGDSAAEPAAEPAASSNLANQLNYEEYLQQLKTSDEYDEEQLRSFAESLLIYSVN